MKTLSSIRSELRSLLLPLYPTSEVTAIERYLIEECLGKSRSELLLMDKDTLLTNEVASQLIEIGHRMHQGLPLQYALGYTDFYGLRIEVAPGVLIPRPETEELIELIRSQEQTSGLRLLDIGTGSACIPLAIASCLPHPKAIDAVELMPDALLIAQRNINQHREQLGNIGLIQADLFKLTNQPCTHPYDIIVSNPPYIHPSEAEDMTEQVLGYEPHTALFTPEENPLLYYEAIATLAVRGWLSRGGRIYLEINPLYAEATLSRMLDLLSPLDPSGQIIGDMSGHQRFISIQTN